MKFSPTTALGYLQAAITAAILWKPLYSYWFVDNYDAVAGLAGATAMTACVNSALAIARGHFTADAPSIPKPDNPPNE